MFRNFLKWYLPTIFLVSIQTVQEVNGSRDLPGQSCEITNATSTINIHCNKSNLAGLSFFFKTIPKVPIEKLTIEAAQIANLYGNVFEHLNFKELQIIDTKIKELGSSIFFGSNTYVKDVSIINSELSEIPTEALSVTKLKSFVLDGTKISTIKKEDFAGWNTDVEKLAITHSNLSSVDTGTFVDLKKLKHLSLAGNDIQELKKSQFQGLRELESLDVSFNQIPKLETTHIGDLGKLTVLNVSNNNIAEVSRGAFAKNPLLKVLNLSHNKIKRLDSHNFRGMRFLRRLHLQDNLITEVNRGTFGSMRRIGTIDLARNQLTKIDFEMFAELQYVEIIDVSDNKITHIAKNAFKNIYLAHINVSNNELNNIEVGAFENCLNLTMLDMSFNKITGFQKGVFDENSYAGVLDLSYNIISNLSLVPLEHMLGLRVLNMSHNILQSIPKKTVLNLYELAVIDMSFNNISEIADGILQQAISLRYLNLTNNSLQTLRASSFGAVSSLLELDLSKNILSKIHSSAFMKLASLRTLTLDDNQLSEMIRPSLSLATLSFKRNKLNSIRKEVWPSMNSLLSLDLSDNLLGNSLENRNFDALLTLRNLYLSNNNISTVTRGAFDGLGSIQYLGLNKNKINKIDKDAFGTSAVMELDLSENMINNISDFSFQSLLILSTLNISSNKIESLNPDAFKGLTSMKVVDLSNNFLQKLNNGTNNIFEYCLNLEEIILHHNKLSFLLKKSFPFHEWTSYRIRKIDLSHNALHVLSNDFAAGQNNLKYLNISHNMLQEFKEGAISKLPSIAEVDLSKNRLEALSLTQIPGNLSYLDVSTNNIKHVVFSKNVSITPKPYSFDEADENHEELIYLNIKENPIDCQCWMENFKDLYLKDDNKQYKLGASLCSDLYNQTDGIHETYETLPTVDCAKFTRAHYTKPDLKIVSAKLSNNHFWISWKVIGNGDLADFYLSLRDVSSNKIINEYHIPYDMRIFNISTVDFMERNDIEICVFVKTSQGYINKYVENQCFRLAQNWKKLNKNCAKNWRNFCNLYDPKSDKFVSSHGVTFNSPVLLLLLLGFSCKFLIYRSI